MATKISRAQVNSWRLRGHHLSERLGKMDIARVVSDVCGVQAQVLSAAELAIRARVDGVAQDDVRDALWRSRTILKTWCMRGTLHLLATSDLPLYVVALRSKLQETERWLQKEGGVAPGEVDSVTAAIKEALSERSLTREELSKEVVRTTRLGPSTRKHLMSAWGILLRPAAYQGHLAFGESQGAKVTFVDPASWVEWREPERTEALLELFRRFLRANGPATVKDFGHWWGNLGEDDRSFLGSLSEELEQVEVDGVRGFMVKRDAEAASELEPASGVNFLPSFDCYAMFYSPRDLLVLRNRRDRIFRKEAGWVFPSVIIGGVAAGIWTIKKRTGRAEIDVEPFRSLTASEKSSIETEAEDIGRFLGASARVRYRRVGQV